MTNAQANAKSIRRRNLWVILLLVVLVGTGYWYFSKYGNQEKPAPNKRSDSVPVGLATISKGDIDVVDRELGTVTPLANITVRTQINGQLQEVAYQEGQIVHKGDFLAQIDPRPYQMTLEQASGALQKDQALLKQAQIDLARYQKLVAQDSISKQQLDDQISLVGQDEGNVETDQGQIDAAKLNIEYCHIVSPITGRAGLRQVDAGNYAQTSDANGIVVLTELDPISVIFTLPEDLLPPVMQKMAAGTELQVEAYDRADTNKLAVGKLTAVDSQIDVTTGTVKLRAQFDNPDGVLFPNQFVNVHLRVDTVKDAVLAPQAAILRGAPGTFVYLTKDDGTVAVRPVKLGVSQADNVQVTDGLAVGDKVVIDGTDKLRDGAKYKLPDGAPTTDKPGTDKQSSDKQNTDQQNTKQHKKHGGDNAAPSQ